MTLGSGSSADSLDLTAVLRRLESGRTIYWEQFDKFLNLRLHWRAAAMRHLFHILPGDRILEVGAGNGQFSLALDGVLKAECLITSAVFDEQYALSLKEKTGQANVETVCIHDFSRDLHGEAFDYIVLHRMLDDRHRQEILRQLKSLLRPGGGILIFEANPWNPYFRLRRFFRSLLPVKWRRPDEPLSLNRTQTFSLLSNLGFSDIQAIPYDFLFPPIPMFLKNVAQHFSLIFENMPFICNFAGSLYVWARNGEGMVWQKDLAEHRPFDGQVSFVVPCFNEQENISGLVDGLKAHYGRYVREIILVDDASTDQTAAAAETIAKEDNRVKVIRRELPRGVGRALKDGIVAATGEYVMLLDCDFSRIIPELRDLFSAIAHGAEAAFGSRFSRESVLINYPFTKILANRSFHFLAGLFFKKRFRDTSNNLKLIKKECLCGINIEYPDFAANAEIGLKLLLSGCRVTEVPISWFERSAVMGLSSFKILRTGPNYARLLWGLVRHR